MPLHCSRLLSVFLLVFFVPAVLPAKPAPADAPLSPDTVRFRTHQGYLMTVKVNVNGVGPLEFLLDTGSTSSAIDPELARQFQAPNAGASTVALLTDVLHVQQVRVNSMALGPAKVESLTVLVQKLDRVTALIPGVRGILGEDFLSHFDVFIDNEHGLLRFGVPAPDGERLPFAAAGNYHGLDTHNRIMLNVGFPAADRNNVVLQLDTAAWVTELFPASGVHLPHLEATSHSHSASAAAGPDGAGLCTGTILRIGTTEFRNITVAEASHAVVSDAVGLLPATLFSSVYISHSGGFVILASRDKHKQPHQKHLEIASVSSR